MMVMTMTMMLNADKMTISGRVWSLRGQGGGEGGSRLTFRLMAVGGGHGGGGHSDCDNQNAPRHIYVALPF